MKKKTAVVICPGRGTYNKAELGYLHEYHEDKLDFIGPLDSYRERLGQLSVWELDGRKQFSPKEHLAGENSAAIIFACSYADFLDINEQELEIVAITGNSMGWYMALVCAGSLNLGNGIHVINTMGSQMKDHIIGGQIIYPEVDDNWIHSQELTAIIDQKIKEVGHLEGHEVYNSIFFGGYRIIGGTDAGLKKLLRELPPLGNRYPFRLMGNAAFHTPLLTGTSHKAKRELGPELFNSPKVPLIDGRGKIWNPHSTDRNDLWDYTLGTQVNETYNFTKSIEVAVKEFAPDYLIITGPGMTLGGAVGQVLINKKLKPINTKLDFKRMQEEDPFVLSMAEPDQRNKVV